MKFTRRKLTAAILLSLPLTVTAQEVTFPDEFEQRMPLYREVLGNFHYPISTTSALAQAYFDQGFQLMYAFAKEESARAFREAQLADPNCAICYWGEAWAWGSYLNGTMTSAEAPRAWQKLHQALERIELASPKEADLIRALQYRYVQDYDQATRRVQDQAYADAMAELYVRYPEDLNIATLYGDALFLLEERRGYRQLDDPNVIRLHAVLSSVLDKDITHPGACHLFVHATESTPTPELAAPCARFLGDSIPGASHINHMPSHTWNEMGLWQDAIRANLKAWHSDQKAAIGRGFAIYPTHNLHMLLYAANMDGQGAIAIQAGKDLAKLSNDTSQYVLSLVHFGRFDETIEISARPAADVNGGMWDFAQGYAHLKLGNRQEAERYLAELRTLTESTQARYRFHDGKDILGALVGILEGEMAWLDGNQEAALAAFRRGTESYDRLNYDEPEPLPFSPRHWLGSLYVEMAAYDRAIEAFETDLKDHPHNGWSLFGIQQALAAQGLQDPEIDRRFEEAWARSDIWLIDPKF